MIASFADEETARLWREALPIHPGEILRDDFLEPFGVTTAALAQSLIVPHQHVSDICNGRGKVTPDFALRLGLYFGMEAEFWMNLQAHYDLQTVRVQSGKRIGSEVRPRAR